MAKYFQAAALLVFLVFLITTILIRSHDLPFVGNTVKLPHPFKSTPASTPDLLLLDVAKDYCETRRWEPYAIRDRKRKVYDLFMINTEHDWMEISMGELADEVDYFIILESAVDFKDRPKPLYVKDSWSRFSNFHH